MLTFTAVHSWLVLAAVLRRHDDPPAPPRDEGPRQAETLRNEGNELYRTVPWRSTNLFSGFFGSFYISKFDVKIQYLCSMYAFWYNCNSKDVFCDCSMFDPYFPGIFVHSSLICRPNFAKSLSASQGAGVYGCGAFCGSSWVLSTFRYDVRWTRWYGCQPKNSGFYPPKWMVKIMENPIKMDNLGVPLFLETPIWLQISSAVDLRQIVLRFAWLPCSSLDLSHFDSRSRFFFWNAWHWRYRLALRKYSDALQWLGRPICIIALYPRGNPLCILS